MSEAAEQTVNMGIKAVETGISLLGSLVKGAVSMVAMTAFLALQKAHGNKTYQKLSDKNTKVLTIPAEKLRDFSRLAKQYHIQHDYYSVVNRKNLNGACDIVVAAEHAPVVSRIAELMDITAVESASFEASGQDSPVEAVPERFVSKEPPEPSPEMEQNRENTLASLLATAKENSAKQRDDSGDRARPTFPTHTAEKSGEAPSGNFSPSKNSGTLNKPSVKVELRKIVREQQEAKAIEHIPTRQKPASRTTPARKPRTPQKGAAR